MTPQQQYQLALHCIGGFFIALGLATAYGNWCIFRAQKQRERQGSTRHISMIFLVGFALPIGCVFFAPLRWCALWVWLLDIPSAMLVLIVPVWLWQKLSRSSS